MNAEHKPLSPWRARIHEIIYEADTFAGKFFDITLLCCILTSIIVVMLESVESIAQEYGMFFNIIEWVFTVLFTIEYIFRILCIGHPVKYILSFYGLVDLLSILPSYLGLFWRGSSESLIVIRSLRLLRVFRLFKLARYVQESQVLINGLRASIPKIIIFTGAVLTMVVIMGTIMYLIEGSGGNPEFDNIFRSMYWAIVTLSTVGY
ncbi:MAG: ion transporter, partial [Planctomycetes bacterium]|nr:ion transporter [Planctomycetota bacterium]